MSIVLGDTLELNAYLPNFSRDLFETISAMKEFSTLPDIFIAENKEDGKLYIYNSSYNNDSTYGRWRPFNRIQTETIDISLNNNSIVQYIGNDSNYEKGKFYSISKTDSSLSSSVEKAETSKLSASIDNSVLLLDFFLNKGSESGDYTFECTSGRTTISGSTEWKLNDEIVDITSIGIKISGKTIVVGDKIIISYTKPTVTATKIDLGGGGSLYDDVDVYYSVEDADKSFTNLSELTNVTASNIKISADGKCLYIITKSDIKIYDENNLNNTNSFTKSIIYVETDGSIVSEATETTTEYNKYITSTPIVCTDFTYNFKL